MQRQIARLAPIAALFALLPGATSATTREIAELQPARLTFGQSILNQLTYGTYRDPYDELQTRPHNLLFSNIGRHANLSPWEGQEGSYTRYLNALIGNNGAANVDNDADTIQGALIRRETAAFRWGVSGSYLNGSDGSNDLSGTSTFSDTDDLSGFDLRVGAALQLSERRVLGAGVRLIQGGNEIVDSSFEQGVGGFVGVDDFGQSGLALDVGLRQFRDSESSWELQFLAGFGSSEQDNYSDGVDAAGVVTDRFVAKNYDLSELNFGIEAGYNRLNQGKLGETEYRIGLERSQRELDNTDLSFQDDGGAVTANLTLLGQDPLAATRVRISAKAVFPAGETEMFSAAELGFGRVEGATQVDAQGTIVNEAIEDSQLNLGLTVGLRQPLFHDKLRFVVSGRAELLDSERTTIFDTGRDGDDSSRTTAQYAIGLEGVLANVTFDIAWLRGDEAPVVPVPLGLPAGSRRSVALDSLIFSAAVSW